MRKPRWIIQTNLISEIDTKGLREALDGLGIPFVGVEVIPFSDELPDFPIDAEHENIYYGTTRFIENLHKKIDPLGIFFSRENFSMKNYMKKWGEHMFNFGAEFMRLSKFIKQTEDSEENIFIRPNGDGKEFNGTVGSQRSLKLIMKNLTLNDDRVFPSQLIMVGKAYSIKREWRLHIVNSRVVTASQYRKNHTLSKSSEVPSKVIQFANKRALEYQPSDAFVMDVCEAMDDGELKLYILECGNINSVGLYHCDKEDYVEGITNYILSHQIPNQTLMVHGKSLPWTEEIEIMDESEFGMNITINVDYYVVGNVTETRHNCTELHHLFDKGRVTSFEDMSSAFESDIHGTGGTKEMRKLKWVKAEKALKLHNSY